MCVTKYYDCSYYYFMKNIELCIEVSYVHIYTDIYKNYLKL